MPMCYGSGSWCLSTWKVSLVMLRAVETFWEIFRICKTPGFLQHSWRLSIGDSHGGKIMPKGDLMQAVHVTQKMRELAESVTFRGLFPYHSRICGYTANCKCSGIPSCPSENTGLS